MDKEQDKEQPNVDILNEVKKAVDGLCALKSEQCQCKDKDALKQQVLQILQNYINQGYTAMKAGCDEYTEIILQKPNTDKCKGICLGDYELCYGECQPDARFHIICGVKYSFDDKQLTYWEEKQKDMIVEVNDKKQIKKIKAIADGLDTDLDVGFCNKYFGWCSCCNGNDNAGLKASRDDSEYINVNKLQYAL